MVGVAVIVTLVPAHIGPAGAATILTDGTRLAVTAIVIWFDAALGGVAHVAFDIILTATTSLLANVVEEKVAELPPTGKPLTVHW